MKIAVIGTGYVGLVTGTCFAESGNEVTCIDKDERKIRLLEQGGIPIYEPGLTELVQRNRADGRLSFTTSLREGIQAAHLIFIAVGTPQAEDGSADLSTVWAVADALGEHIHGPKIVVIKSTVPVGTNREVARRIAARCQHPVDVASNPEFLKEGAAIEDCMKPDRVVVGVRRHEVAEVLRELYAPFLRTERPFLAMSPESAEMTKYAANAMLATKISYINEMANLCERVGADINDVRRGIGHDVRIGFQFLFPGAGYGGSCFTPQETVFTVDEQGGITTTSLQRLFATVARRASVAEVARTGIAEGEEDNETSLALLPPQEDAPRVLAYDLTHDTPQVARVHALTRRPYQGGMVTLRLGLGRTLRVTDDHPMILWSGVSSRLIPARDVQPGDTIALLAELPVLPPPAALDLIELLAGTEQEDNLVVAATDDAFTAQYERYASHFPPHLAPDLLAIKNTNRMPLSLYRKLRDRGLIDVPSTRLQLAFAAGAETRIHALVPLDADCARLCGYYLSAGQARRQVEFRFHPEDPAIDEVRRLLRGLGLTFRERTKGQSHRILVPSPLFAWLVRDVLGCGAQAKDRALPRFVFQASLPIRQALVGTVVRGPNPLAGWTTVSKRLAHGLALLWQSLGVVPSLRRQRRKRSGHVVYLVRPNRLPTPDGRILVPVRAVDRVEVDTTVYSLETSTGTVIAGAGLLCHNCFPKDIRAIIHMSRTFGAPAPLMESVDQVNEAQKQVLSQKIREHYGPALGEKTLAIWGLAFKPRTDDIREAPALALIDNLLAAGVKLRVHDPEAMKNVRQIYGDRLVYCDRPYGALEGADGLAIVTEWQQFRNPDFELMRRLMNEPVVFDGRNLYEPRTLAEAGFTYHSIGRATVQPGQ